jgi:hypothetical protein
MESGSETVNHRVPPPPSRDGGDRPATLRPELAKRPERSSIVPPYWQRRERSDSTRSVTLHNSTDNIGRILLEDHTDEGSEQCKTLWAKHVTINDHVVVSGTAPGLGSYVAWNCTVETLDVSVRGAVLQWQYGNSIRLTCTRVVP